MCAFLKIIVHKMHGKRTNSGKLGPKSNHNMDLLMKTVIFDKQLTLIMIEIHGDDVGGLCMPTHTSMFVRKYYVRLKCSINLLFSR